MLAVRKQRVPCSLCPARTGCCPPGGTGSEEPGVGSSASPSHAPACRMLVAALMFCSGTAQQRLPDTFSFTAAICAWKGHISHQQKAVTVAASSLAAVVTAIFTGHGVCSGRKAPKAANESRVSEPGLGACGSAGHAGDAVHSSAGFTLIR